MRADAVADAGPYAPVLLNAAPAWVNAGEALPRDADAMLPPDTVTGHEVHAGATVGDGVLAAGADATPGHASRRAGESVARGRCGRAAGGRDFSCACSRAACADRGHAGLRRGRAGDISRRCGIWRQRDLCARARARACRRADRHRHHRWRHRHGTQRHERRDAAAYGRGRDPRLWDITRRKCRARQRKRTSGADAAGPARCGVRGVSLGRRTAVAAADRRHHIATSHAGDAYAQNRFHDRPLRGRAGAARRWWRRAARLRPLADAGDHARRRLGEVPPESEGFAAGTQLAMRPFP